MVFRPLKGYRSFEEVLRSGRRVTSGPLLLAALPSDSQHQHLTVGVGVPKRNVPKAVVRNRIKRLMREAVRTSITKHHHVLGSTRIILLWRQRVDLPSGIHLDDVHEHIEKALAKLSSRGPA